MPEDNLPPTINNFFTTLTERIAGTPTMTQQFSAMEKRLSALESEVDILKRNGTVTQGAHNPQISKQSDMSTNSGGNMTDHFQPNVRQGNIVNAAVSTVPQIQQQPVSQPVQQPVTMSSNIGQATVSPQPELDLTLSASKAPGPLCPTKLLVRCKDYNTEIKKCGSGCYLLYSEDDLGTLTQQWISDETAQKEDWPGQSMPNVLFHCSSEEFKKLPKWKYNSNNGMATRASEITKTAHKAEDRKNYFEALAGFCTEMVEKKVHTITMLSQLDSSQSPCNRIIKWSTQLVCWTLLTSDITTKGAPTSAACNGEFERIDTEGMRLKINLGGGSVDERQLVAIGILPKTSGEVFREGEKFDSAQFFRFCMKENGWATKEMKKVVRK